MSNTNEQYLGEDIAIVSIAGRFPGADSIEKLWQNIRDGIESIEIFTDEELKEANIDPALYNESNYIKAGAIINDIDKFDAKFFGFNPREAQLLNPQHRIFLECTWEALERAGYSPEKYDGRIGVYAGEGFNTYLLNIAMNPKMSSSMNDIQMLIGNDKDFLSTQVSYKFNLTGPSMTVQSGCSTSLVAISLACQGLRNYQCDMALAGGIRLGIPQKTGYLYKEGSILSADGHCRPFDADANGTVGGNGAAVVTLKRLEDALEDGDHIHAVIKGTAINNDGSLKIGYTAPSVEGQMEAVFEGQEVAGISPETIGYIETHGTGTVLGDPIEFNALNEVFRNSTDKKGFCALGSIKANIGHLDSAAGAAGVIKAALAIENKIIPPCVNYNKPNPKIDLENSPFYVPKEAKQWDTEGTPRRAGVSSFGIGGTNAHAILEESPTVESTSTNEEWHMLTLSAKSENALENMKNNMTEYFKNNEEANIADVAYTLQNGRKEFDYRKTVIYKSVEDAVQIMEKSHHERIVTGDGDVDSKKIVFMFPGQGSQYIDMGLELYEKEEVFREAVDTCATILEPHLGVDIREILYPKGDKESASEQIKQTYLAQPTIFTIEYAMAKTLISYGISPSSLVGHSIGEYVAACLSGVFSLHDALPLIASRGRMMQGQPKGVMTAVTANEEKIRPLLVEEVSIAAVNSPKTCVISGPEDKVRNVEKKLEEEGIKYTQLHTSHAFHSSMMNSILEPFATKVARAEINEPKIPIVSNLTGDWLKDEEAKDSKYWARHLAETVKFSQCINKLMEDDNLLLIEVGPGNTLSTLARQHRNESGALSAISTMRHPRQEKSDLATLYTALGKMWTKGMNIDFSRMYENEKRLRVPLPTYPFERKRYWVETDKQMAKAPVIDKKLSKNEEVSQWLYTPYWKPSAPVVSPCEESSKWLIFADENGLTEEITSRLIKQGCEVTKVSVGEKYNVNEDGTYTINPEIGQEYTKLLESLKDKEKLPNNIIHMWSLEESNEDNNIDFDEIQKRGFYSLTNIVQGVGKLNIIDPIKISVITDHMQEVGGEKEIYPEKSTILGACRVIPQEFINISCISIDISPVKSDNQRQKEYFADSIINETLEAGNTYAVAYRNNTRWIQDFENVKPAENNVMRNLEQEGVYLITGGLGNIGLVFAEYLAKEYKGKLVLVGRSQLPERKEWDQWLETKGAEDRISKKLIKVRELEALGAEVMECSADVSDEEQMNNVVTEAIERFGKINGVIHGAGVVGKKTYCSIQDLNKDNYKEQMIPKIYGTYTLEKVLRDINIDFCLLISSLSSILGGLGLTSYSAVNIFMDAFAKKQNRQSAIPWISIDWDGWAVSDEMESPDGLFIAPEEGTVALEYILTKGMVKNAIVSVGDLKQRINQWITGNSISGSTKGKSQKKANGAIGDTLEEKIAYIWSDLLGIEDVGYHDDFFELGGNSLIATQVIYRLRSELQLDIPIKEFFETPTIGGLVEKMNVHEDSKKEIAATLDKVKSLSKEEVENLLKQVKNERNN